ncbi:MAG: carboxypeptidase regulatory-like domain-containing protein, partial [Chloroflexi bacterium]|nr:carboxypeptidase regulatory-like domain-containing protein [Chloroflexota bacterium]
MPRMLRIVIATVAALAAALLAAPALADSGTGTINGRVVNKTPGGSPLGALQVTLTTYNNTTAGSKQQATADGAGKFQFDGLSLDPATTYTVTTRFQDVEYAWASEKRDRVALTATAPSANIELVVYDTTTSSS